MRGTVFNIQVLRAVAALLVVVYHMQPMINASYGTRWNSQIGAFGVDIFFVISGFVMFYTNREMQRSSTAFFADRILRIVPLYWVATFVIVAFWLAGFHPNGLQVLSASILAKSLIFVPSEFPDGRTDLVLSLGWTLMFELYFYMAFAATFWMRSIEKSFFTVASFFSLGIALSILVARLPHLLQFYFSTITLEFLFGALCAIAYVRWQSTSLRYEVIAGAGLILLGVILAGVSSVSIEYPDIGGFRFLYFGLPALLIVGGALVLEKAGWQVRSEFLLLVGAASYSLYLFHPVLLQPTVKTLSRFLPLPPSVSIWITTLIAIGVSLAGAIAIHLKIEAKIMSVGRQFVRRRTQEQKQPAGHASLPLA
jgi:exopolysaccharide production protein ExoZ